MWLGLCDSGPPHLRMMISIRQGNTVKLFSNRGYIVVVGIRVTQHATVFVANGTGGPAMNRVTHVTEPTTYCAC